MPGHNDLGNGAHAHGVSANGAEVAVFGRRFVARAGACNVHALLQGKALLGGNLFCHLDKLRVVRAGHVRETRTEFIQVGADERVGHKVDVVSDNHEISHVVAQVGAAGGIGHKEVLDAHQLHNADGEGDQVHAVALVIVDAALHGHHHFAGQFAHNELSFVADGGRNGEAGDSSVGNYQRVFNFVGQAAQAAAQDYAHNGFAPFQDLLDVFVGQFNGSYNAHILSIILVISKVILSAAALAATTTSCPSFT